MIKEMMIDGEFERERLAQTVQVSLERLPAAWQSYAVGTQDQVCATRMLAGDLDEFPEPRVNRGLAAFELNLKHSFRRKAILIVRQGQPRAAVR